MWYLILLYCVDITDQLLIMTDCWSIIIATCKAKILVVQQ